jgi:Flp pilus assembly protein TadD
LIGAVVSISTLGFILNLAKAMRDASQARAEVISERLAQSKDDLERTEKWNDKEKRILKEEIDGLKERLARAGITTSIQAEDANQRVSEVVRASLETYLKEVRAVFHHQFQTPDSFDPGAALQLGRGLMATGDWQGAASFLSVYTEHNPEDWEAQFALAISYNNSRKGRENDFAGLRAMTEAILYGGGPANSMPDQIRSRAHIYRGVYLKRLSRLEEAEVEIQFGLKISQADYEKADGTYNLASIYAVQGRRKELLDILSSAQQLKQKEYIWEMVRSRLDSYFCDFANDSDFLHALDLLSHSAAEHDPPRGWMSRAD